MDSAELPPIRDRLQALGLTNLGENAPPDVWLGAVREWARTLRGDHARRAAERDAVIQLLDAAGVGSPARVVDGALDDVKGSPDAGATSTPQGTAGGPVVDIVRTEDDGLAFVAVDGGDVSVVPEVEGRSPWPLHALPWAPIPTAQAVRDALRAGGEAPFGDVADLIAGRVVLPEPQRPWSELLAAWSLGTYLLSSFTYYPIPLLEGPPERGKTRLGKALLWPAFRGYYTPTPTSATIFRDRAHHQVTLMLDVENLPRALERSDLNDLILAGFERDGVVRRCTRPDAEPEEQIETFAAYGATILTSNKVVRADSPLASRCLRVPMPEAGGVEVPDAVTPEEVERLRARCIAWAASRRALRVPLPDAEVPFTGRMADLARPLLRTLNLVAPSRVSQVLGLLADLDAERRVDAFESWEARVAVGLWDARDRVRAGRLYLDDLAAVVNDGRSEEETLTRQQIGTARKNLGLKAGRGGAGGSTFVRWPGEERVRALHDRYTPSREGGKQPSGSSGSSETQAQTGLSGLNTREGGVQGLQGGVQSQDPHKSATSEHAEHPEHLESDSGEEGGEERFDTLDDDAPKTGTDP